MMTKKLALFATLVGVAAAGTLTARGAGTLAAQSTATPVDTAAVKKTFERGALLLVQGGASNEYAPGWHGGPMAVSQAMHMHDKVVRDFTSVFGPTVAQKYVTAIEGHLAEATARNPNIAEPGALSAAQRQTVSYPIVHLDGGVSSVRYRRLDITGDTATIVAKVEDWAAVAQVRGGHLYRAYPHNGKIDTATLKRVSGRWIIVSLETQFSPGEGP